MKKLIGLLSLIILISASCEQINQEIIVQDSTQVEQICSDTDNGFLTAIYQDDRVCMKYPNIQLEFIKYIISSKPEYSNINSDNLTPETIDELNSIFTSLLHDLTKNIEFSEEFIKNPESTKQPHVSVFKMIK
jgi:hypothetical protein